MQIVILDADIEKSEELKNRLIPLLKSNFENKPHINVYQNPFAFVTAIYDEMKGDVDLIFVHLSEEKDENIMIAHDIQEFFPHIRVIFYSETCSCAENIFLAIPTYFLKAPIGEKALTLAIQRVISNIQEERNQMLHLVCKGQHQKVKFNSIKYIESAGRKLNIYTQEGLYEINMTMAEIMERLPKQFVVCHRSYVINLDKVMMVQGDVIQLSTREMIPLSRSKHKEIAALL